MIGVLFAYGISCAAGYVFIRAVFSGRGSRSLHLFLAPGLGLAVASAALFLEFMVFGKAVFWMTLSGHAAVLFFAGYSLRHGAGGFRIPPHAAVPAALAALAALLTVVVLLKSPFGTGLDAWAVWKLKARFLAGAAEWKALFSPEIGFSHPDYPLFYPLAMLWGWFAAGRETPQAAQALAVLFTAAAAGLIYSAFPGGRAKGAAAALFLISTPFFTGMGASQYADMLVAYFLLGSVVLLEEALRDGKGRRRHAALGGFFLAAGGFVKNEGLLIFAAGAAAFLVLAPPPRRAPEERAKLCLSMLAGSAPMLCIVGLFKISAAVSNDIVNAATLRGIFGADAPQRLVSVFGFWLREVTTGNSWSYAWFFFGAAMIFYAGEFLKKERLWILVFPGLLNAGYIAAYLISPVNLEWQLGESIGRLLLHSFPLWTYLCFRCVPIKRRKKGSDPF